MNGPIVLLDVGNVLFHYQPAARLEALGHFTGLDPARVEAALDGSRLVARLDKGTATQEDLVAFIGALAGKAVTAAECWHLWFKVFTPNVGLLNQLPALTRTFRLGVLSNNPGALRGVLESHLGLQTVFLSGELGVTKPLPGIFEAVEQRLGLTGDAICLVDDSIPNLEAAATRGWRILHYACEPGTPSMALAPRLREVTGC
ncbi:HAD-IA family hydrolase [Pseudomonas sp. TE3610]